MVKGSDWGAAAPCAFQRLRLVGKALDGELAQLGPRAGLTSAQTDAVIPDGHAPSLPLAGAESRIPPPHPSPIPLHTVTNARTGPSVGPMQANSTFFARMGTWGGPIRAVKTGRQTASLWIYPGLWLHLQRSFDLSESRNCYE